MLRRRHNLKRVRGGQAGHGEEKERGARADAARAVDRKRAPFVAAAVTAAALIALEPVTSAQLLPPVDARTWRPSTDPRASLATEPVTTPGPWQWNVGGSLQYAQDPVEVRRGPGPLRLVERQLAGDLIAAIGLGERVAIGLDVPVFLWQDGTTPPTPTTLRPYASPLAPFPNLPTTGFGDPALVGKVTILPNDRKGINAGVGLAAAASVTAPTGDRASLMSEDDVTASLQTLGEYALGAAAVRLSLGYFHRTLPKYWGSSGPDANGDIVFGDAVTWAAGFMLRPKAIVPSLDGDDRQTWELAAHGAVPVVPAVPLGLGGGWSPAISTALLAIDDRIGLGHYRDTYMLLGTEVGLSDAIGVPSFRGVLSFGWAPRNHDRDGDGVLDDADQCPDLPEDRDGIQDEDGCPEDDADGDEILDEQDACPLVPGVASMDPKSNGCPGPKTQSPSSGVSTPRDGGVSH
jgi:OOP family OmpA-OmpF porin